MTSKSVSPSAKPTQRTAIPTISPATYIPPSSTNYFIFNGKYFSTLANVNLNDGQSYCQPGYFYLPTDWVLAPDNSDSKSAIFLNTWSTYTVVVDSGVGYFSKSSFGSINKANNKWLLSTFISQFGYAYSCYPCNCEILIMYLPRTPAPSMRPTYDPVAYPSSAYYSSSSSSGVSNSLYPLFVLPFFFFFCIFACITRYRRRVSVTQLPPQIQVQPAVNATGYYEQPMMNHSNVNNNYMVYGNGNNNNIQQPQPHQPYMQLQSQQANQAPVYGYMQPQPQVYGSILPQLQEQTPVYPYIDAHQLSPQPYPQSGGYSPTLQPGGGDYYAQPQPYNPSIVYTATALPVYDDHGRAPPTHGGDDTRPHYMEGSSYPKS